MVNEFPTFPGLLNEVHPWSLSDLALMSPEEMSPEAELAYINELRAYRERYERAIGQGAPKRTAAKTSKSAAQQVIDGAIDASDVEF